MFQATFVTDKKDLLRVLSICHDGQTPTINGKMVDVDDLLPPKGFAVLITQPCTHATNNTTENGAGQDLQMAAGYMIRTKFDTFCICGFNVLPDFRGQGLGDLTVRMLLDKGLRMGAQQFELETCVKMAGFFNRFGFQQQPSTQNKNALPLCAKAKEICFPKKCQK